MGASTLAAIVRRLGGDLYDGGRRAVVPGPGHGPGDRSVSLLLAEGRVLAHSFAGQDWRGVLDALRAEGLIDERNRLVGGSSAHHPTRPSRPERARTALELWRAGRDIAGTLAEVHARKRGVHRRLGEALRFHSAAPSAVYDGRGLARPALLARIDDASGAFAGVELTYLDRSGAVAGGLRVPRKTVGGRPTGSAVRLDAASRELLVGEGVFTCLSASQALRLPTWALLSVGNLRAWSPPAGVERVVIAVDRGGPGEAGAAVLSARLRRMGVAVEMRLPPGAFGDWNDAVRRPARGSGEGGEAEEGGPEPGDWPPGGPGDPP
jgi:hypothetical protein